MFKIADKTELNQISLTGVRGIVLAGLLIMQPRSLEEIRKAFIELNIMENENSDDILRIDLNTLKIMGCEISRASAKTGFKYVLGKHPFAFKIDDEEIVLLKKHIIKQKHIQICLVFLVTMIYLEKLLQEFVKKTKRSIAGYFHP